VKAAYAALVLGIVGGVGLATTVLSGGPHAMPPTVAGTLALDVPGIDMDRRRAEAVALLVSACMNERGLDWEPWVEPPPAVPDADLAPVEWAERWGFGVSTTAGGDAPVAPVDPNLRRSASAPPDVRDGYRRALHGGSGVTGCQGAATTEVYGLRERLLAPLRPALVALESRVAADPAARRLVASWQACVGPVADGVPRHRPTFAARLIERFGRRMVALGSGVRSIPGRAALQADERRVAAIVARCDVAYDARRTAVAASHEAVFVAANRPALERIGAAIRAAEAALPTLPP
jgi:hypothetical protein